MKRSQCAAARGAIGLAACTPAWTSSGSPEPMPVTVASRTVPHTDPGRRFTIYRTSTGQQIGFDELVESSAKADVVFFGEQHDDPETHFAEFALLEALGHRHASVTVSLEMFERDVQPALSQYLEGQLGEADFLAQSRPWERYATDYRPMVQLARARGWPVVAANVPRPMASAVSRAEIGRAHV